MYTFSQSIEIERPAEVVWPYLAALEQVGTWEEGVGPIDVLTPRPIRVGTQIAARRNFANAKTRLSGEIREWEEGRTGTMAIRGGPIELALATFSVEPIDANRSRVTYTGEVELRGALRWLSAALPAMGRRQMTANLNRLRARVLSGIEPTSDEPTPS